MDAVIDELRTKGYAVAEHEMSWEEFLGRSAALGDVLLKEDVRLHKTERALHRADALEFHTDYPGARFVAWWCLWQDADGGALELVDGCAASSLLTPESASILKRTPIKAFGRDAMPSVDWSLLFRPEHAERDYINYNPFGVPEAPSHDVTHALLEFRLRVRQEFERTGASIMLRPRQALWIDNWRILHGRKTLRSDSERFLKRLWLTDRSAVS